MSGQHHLLVIPDAQRLRNEFTAARVTLDTWANAINVSPTTASKLLAGMPVRPRSLERVAKTLGVPPEELVNKAPTTAIPEDHQLITAMRWGWFIEGMRPVGETAIWKWEKERITLRCVHRNAQMLRRGFMLKGSITNTLHKRFSVVVQRLSTGLLALWAQATEKDYAFSATFTEYFSELRVLSGVWTGVNNLNNPAVHRIFLSEGKLTSKTLAGLTEAARHEVVLKASEMS